MVSTVKRVVVAPARENFKKLLKLSEVHTQVPNTEKYVLLRKPLVGGCLEAYLK